MSNNTNTNNKETLKDVLKKHDNSHGYADVIVNVPSEKETSKGASFQIGDSFRTPQHVSGVKNKYGEHVNVDKNSMDYVAAFAKDSIEKMHKLNKILDPNKEHGLIQDYENSKGEINSRNNMLAGSVTVTGENGKDYRINVAQRNIGIVPKGYNATDTEKAMYGDNYGESLNYHSFKVNIAISEKDGEGKYSIKKGDFNLWGKMDARGNLVSSLEPKGEGFINSYFALEEGKNERHKAQITSNAVLAATLIKEGFSYTREQLEAEKADPSLRKQPKNMEFRSLDTDVAEKLKKGFVKKAEEVTQGTTREIAHTNIDGSENGKALFVNVILDNQKIKDGDKTVNKTGVILTPQVWTDDKHKIDYSERIGRVNDVGERDIKKLGENINKAVAEYAKKNPAKDLEVSDSKKSLAKAFDKGVTKPKGKSKGEDIGTN